MSSSDGINITGDQSGAGPAPPQSLAAAGPPSLQSAESGSTSPVTWTYSSGPTLAQLAEATATAADAIVQGVGDAMRSLGALGNSVVTVERLLATMPPNVGIAVDAAA